ncbi:hypothetical protein ACQP1G_17265 [Nocardia sp. CA-107356]|uniref:hypothetical protein n=1 Tax=Nocardia sp. CA-107356 TaxID=3239972 RepID=UPI003D8FC902
MIDVLILGASWAPENHPVTNAFAEALDPVQFSPRMVLYSGIRAEAERALASEIDRCDKSVVVAGYAQGAAFAGDFVARSGAGTYRGKKIIACALIADPLRPRGCSIGRDPGGYGILGQRVIHGTQAYWAAAPADLTTALPAHSSLRAIPEVCEYLGISTEGEMVRWGRNVIDASIREQLRGYPLRVWRGRNPELTRGVGYLFAKSHSDDYLKHGHVVSLADTLNSEVIPAGGEIL